MVLTFSRNISQYLPQRLFFPCILSLKSKSYLLKFYLLQWKPSKNDEKFFFFVIFKAIFVLKIFNFLIWLVGHVEKTTWLEGNIWWIQNLCRDKRLSNFCFDFFGHVGKWLDRKGKVNFKIYNVTNSETNICNTHIAIN